MAVDDLWYTKQRDSDGERVKSAKHGRGRRWRVRYADDHGKRHQPTFHRKPDAERFDANTRADLSRGQYVDPAAGKVTLHAHAQAWLADQTFDEASRQSVETRLAKRILPALGEREVRTLKPSTIQTFIRGLQAEGFSPRYVRQIGSLLSTLLSAAVDNGLLAKNPCQAGSVRLPTATVRKVVPWTVEQVMALTDVIDEGYEAAVHVGYGLGMRQGEILALAVDDIDFLRQNVHVCRQIRIIRNTLVFAPPKGDKERDVPLPDDTALLLSAHIKTHPPVKATLPWKLPTGRPLGAMLLFTRAGEAINRHTFNSCIWLPALTAAGLANGEDGMHKLRHTYASTLLADGVDIRALAEYLGHTDPGFTLRTYTHLMPKVEDRARSAINRALRKCAQSVPDDLGRSVDAGQTG